MFDQSSLMESSAEQQRFLFYVFYSLIVISEWEVEESDGRGGVLPLERIPTISLWFSKLSLAVDSTSNLWKGLSTLIGVLWNANPHWNAYLRSSSPIVFHDMFQRRWDEFHMISMGMEPQISDSFDLI